MKRNRALVIIEALTAAVGAPAAGLWPTPLEGANRLLAGAMTSADWLPYTAMLAIWVVGLHAAGLRRLDREPSPDPGTPA